MLEEFALCLKEGRGEDALRFLKSGEEYYLDRVFDLQ
jgi:hypothetical protein